MEEIEEVNANCILMANLQQALTSGTLTDKALVYDSDGSAEVHHYENCYDNDIFNMFTQEEYVEHNRGIVEQHPATLEETRAYFESLYNNLVTKVEKVNTVNRKMKETNADLTTKLARYRGQEKSFEINKEKFDELETDINKWSSPAYQEFHKIIKDEIDPIVDHVDARIQNFENYFVKEAAKFVQDFKSLAKEANKSLDKITVLEKEKDRLLRAVVSQDIMSIVQNPSVLDTSNLQTELDRTKEKLETCIIKKENEYAKL
ncbi:hypothetical protein Tco_1158105 [Tanacetum coccineum]